MWIVNPVPTMTMKQQTVIQNDNSLHANKDFPIDNDDAMSTCSEPPSAKKRKVEENISNSFSYHLIDFSVVEMIQLVYQLLMKKVLTKLMLIHKVNNRNQRMFFPFQFNRNSRGHSNLQSPFANETTSQT